MPTTLRDLVERASEISGESVNSILGHSRYRGVVRVRWSVMYAAYYELGMTSVMIGRGLGGRDHSTVLHGLTNAKRLLMQQEHGFTMMTDMLVAMVRAGRHDETA